MVLKAAVALVCAVAVLTSGYMLTGLIQTGHRNETVLVLGCSVKGERPSRMLRQRIEAATEYLEKNPDSKAVLSGGQGPDEKISEAECMRRELVRRGIAADRLYLEDRSTSTEENVAFSAKIIEQNGLNRHVTVVTSDFHCRRGMLLCQRAGLTASSTPAATDVYLLAPTGCGRCWRWSRPFCTFNTKKGFLLKGLAICDLQPDGYRGVCRSNQLADYMTDAKIGGRVTDFLENFVDDESQEIQCTVAAACAARQMVDLLGSRGADCELITFNDENESAGLFWAARFWGTMCAPRI